MDGLKKLFPMSFKYTESGANLAKGIILYIFAGVLAALAITISTLITGWIPVLGGVIAWALGIVAGLVEIYVVAGIVIQVLVFTDVIKK